MVKQEWESGIDSLPVRSRGRPKSIQAHQAIIDATVVLVAQLGIAGTSMDAIAEKVGVSKATVYKHYGYIAFVVDDILPPWKPRFVEVRGTIQAVPWRLL